VEHSVFVRGSQPWVRAGQVGEAEVSTWTAPMGLYPAQLHCLAHVVAVGVVFDELTVRDSEPVGLGDGEAAPGGRKTRPTSPSGV
jgi:hypothetical protein